MTDPTQAPSKDLSSALGYMQAAHIALCEIRKPDDYVLKARDRLALATNILMPIVRAALEPGLTYSQACALLAAYGVALHDRQCCGDELQPEYMKALTACTDAMGVKAP